MNNWHIIRFHEVVLVICIYLQTTLYYVMISLPSIVSIMLQISYKCMIGNITSEMLFVHKPLH